MVFTKNIQDIDNYNAIRDALLARFRTILDSPEWDFDPAIPEAATDEYAASAADIAALQGALVTFIGTMNYYGESWARDVSDKDAIEYYTTATVFEDLGLEVGGDGTGFRRVTGNPTAEQLDDPDFEHGYCQSDDIAGAWIWDDMQAILDLLATSAATQTWQGETGIDSQNWGNRWVAAWDGHQPEYPTTDEAWATAKSDCESNQNLSGSMAYPLVASAGAWDPGETWGYIYATFHVSRGKYVVTANDAADTVINFKYLEIDFPNYPYPYSGPGAIPSDGRNYTYSGPEAVNTWATVASDTWVGGIDLPTWVAKPPIAAYPDNNAIEGWQVGQPLTITTWTF